MGLENGLCKQEEGERMRKQQSVVRGERRTRREGSSSSEAYLKKETIEDH